MFKSILGGHKLNASSKVLPLTVICLSPLSGFKSHPGHVRKLPMSIHVYMVALPCTSVYLVGGVEVRLESIVDEKNISQVASSKTQKWTLDEVR